MAFFKFVIALGVLSLAVDDANANEPTCFDRPVVAAAGREAFKYIDGIIRSHITAETNNSYSFDAIVAESSFLKVVNDTCNITRHITTAQSMIRNSLKFLDILELSLHNGTFKEFLNYEGVNCINSIRENITECIHLKLGNINETDNPNYQLWKKSFWTQNEDTCSQTRHLDKCIIDVLQRQCKPQVQKYVKALFQLASAECPRNQTSTDKSDAGSNDALLLTLFILVLITLIIVVLFMSKNKWAHLCRPSRVEGDTHTVEFINQMDKTAGS